MREHVVIALDSSPHSVSLHEDQALLSSYYSELRTLCLRCCESNGYFFLDVLRGSTSTNVVRRSSLNVSLLQLVSASGP